MIISQITPNISHARLNRKNISENIISIRIFQIVIGNFYIEQQKIISSFINDKITTLFS